VNTSFDLALAEVRSRPFQALKLDEPVEIDALPTPALLLDEQALQRNINKMAEYLGGRGKGFRPHGKTHKCPLIAHRQRAAGAVGVCVAKVSEAVAMVHAGIDDVLVTSPITSPAKARILAELTASAKVSIVVDQLQGIELLAQAAADGAPLGVVADIDIAMGRTGTRSDEMLLQIAELATSSSALEFLGVQHYAGHVMHIEGFEARKERSLALWEGVTAKVELLAARGFPCQIVTGCGTGTYNIDSGVPAITDLQVGSYVFMDQEYRLIGSPSAELFDDFEVSLTLATTAISQPGNRAITVDGGYKAFASDSVNPEPLSIADSKFRFAGDEHGVLIYPEGFQEPLLGTVQRFITPHCDPTVNLHDAYWVHRDGMVTERWPITARGCSW
jgi:3-hydroxy-D-aspartate aldolase